MLYFTILLLIFYCHYLFVNIKEANESERELLYLAKKHLEEDEYEYLKNRQIWVGMPKCLIYFSDHGAPEEIIQDSSEQETWLYESWEYKYAGEIRTKYAYRILIKNSFVTDWKRIKR